MFFNRKKNDSRDINVLPKNTQNNYYYTLKSYIDIVHDCLSHKTKYNENNIYKYKCIISSYLSDLKIMFNLNSIKKFIRKYKPINEEYSILDILNHLTRRHTYNENVKKIKLLFSDVINNNKTKRRRSTKHKRKTRK
jgi:hypothetical protein